MVKWEKHDAIPMMAVRKIADRVEPRDVEAQELDRPRRAVRKAPSKVPVLVANKPTELHDAVSEDSEPGMSTVADAVLVPEVSLRQKVETESEFLDTVRRGLGEHKLFAKVLSNINQFNGFVYEDNILYRKNNDCACPT